MNVYQKHTSRSVHAVSCWAPGMLLPVAAVVSSGRGNGATHRLSTLSVRASHANHLPPGETFTAAASAFEKSAGSGMVGVINQSTKFYSRSMPYGCVVTKRRGISTSGKFAPLQFVALRREHCTPDATAASRLVSRVN